MDRQVVFILSTNYAGSHFLALQLGSHSRCASIGEFRRFESRGKRRLQICARCANEEACPLFRGLRGLPTPDLYGKLFQNVIRYDGKVNTIIDNSKNLRWASQFLNMPGFTKKYIHLVRDPRALVRRWTLNYDGIQTKQKVRIRTARRCWTHFFNILRKDEANVYLWKWLYQNKRITSFIRAHHLDSQLATYHDLVFYSDEVLSRLMQWLGLDYEPQQTQYWSFVHHGSIKPAYMSPRDPGQRLFDQRWKDFLDEKTQQAALTHPGIAAYLKDIGLHYDAEKGLTRRNIS